MDSHDLAIVGQHEGIGAGERDHHPKQTHDAQPDEHELSGFHRLSGWSLDHTRDAVR